MASAYENAMAEKQRLELQRQQIDGRLAEIETFLRLHRQFEANLGIVAEGRVKLPSPTVSGYLVANKLRAHVTDIEKRRGVTQKEFETHLYAILSDAKRPLKFAEIRKKLEDRAVFIGGDDKNKNLSTKLWYAVNKHERFSKREGQAYWFRDTAIPDSDAEPESALESKKIIDEIFSTDDE
jgi:hypothetical protein